MFTFGGSFLVSFVLFLSEALVLFHVVARSHFVCVLFLILFSECKQKHQHYHQYLASYQGI